MDAGSFVEELFADSTVKDDLLRMMFSFCHPRLSEAAQIALILNILCGFDITAPADFSARLPAVQRALYLLFNEGYHGASPKFAVRVGLCREEPVHCLPGVDRTIGRSRAPDWA